jgi:2'-5' RNA ligase
VNLILEQRVDEEDWKEFRRIKRLGDHWDRHDWPPERRYLTWYVVFDDPGLRAHVAALQDELADLDYLDPIPPDGLHMTIQGVAYVDELGEEQIDAIGSRAKDLCSSLRPFGLSLGPIAGYRGGTFLRASPWDSVVEVRGRVREAVFDVLGDRELAEPSVGFKPHVSVTYCHAEPPASALVSRLVKMRTKSDTIEVPVPGISLLEVWREHRTYRWNVRRHIDFVGNVDR